MHTTFRSPIFKNNIPDADAIIVERRKKVGATVIGKTNASNIGAGLHMFNPVFGTTFNPYDSSKT